MLALRRCSWLRSLAVLVWVTGCIPYTVGHTAKPARMQEVKVTTSLFMVDKNQEGYSHTSGWNYVGVDVEGRAGLTNHSDIGVRLISGNGFALSTMRRLNGASEDPGASVSVKFSAGMVDFPNYGLVEGALLASGDETGRVTPFGGLRVVQVVRFDTTERRDSPTAGVSFGARFGDARFGVSPEVGIFYDKPFAGVNRQNFIVVPSISINGNVFAWLYDVFRNVGR